MAQATLPPSDPPLVDDSNLSGTYPIAKELIATRLYDRTYALLIEQALADAGFVAAGADSLGDAWTVLAEVSGDIERDVRSLRGQMRPDTALIAIAQTREEVAAAIRAGAFAGLQAPVIPEQLVRVIGSATDARSARMQLQDLSKQLDLQAHLASIGRISAGLAHEIGNPLLVASLALETLQSEMTALTAIPGASADNARAALDECSASLLRLRELTALMHELVGKQPPTMERVALPELVDRVCAWAENDALDGVEVQKAFDHNVTALAHSRLLEQILVNLLHNAAHAARLLGSPRLRLHAYATDSEAIVSVRDNGPGIAPEMQERIFEPFFTTRRGQGGTGLGLALSREYARRMGASLTVWSAVGRGACFRVHLKLAP